MKKYSNKIVICDFSVIHVEVNTWMRCTVTKLDLFNLECSNTLQLQHITYTQFLRLTFMKSYFAKSKVSQLEVALVVKKKVVWFNITMHYSMTETTCYVKLL